MTKKRLCVLWILMLVFCGRVLAQSSDNFDDGIMASFWALSQHAPSGVGTESNGRFNFVFDGTSSCSVTLNHMYMLSGDFDMSIDFGTSASVPMGSYGGLGLAVADTADANNEVCGLAYTYTLNPKVIQFGRTIGGVPQQNLLYSGISDPGKMRIVRAGSTFTGYVWTSAWQSVGTFTGFTGPAYIGIATMHAMAAIPGCSFYVDNFQVTGSLSPAPGFRFTRVPVGGWMEVGQSLNLLVEVTGAVGNLSYQWSKNGTAISGATTSAFSIGFLQESDQGSYVCSVSDGSKALHTTPPAFVSVFPTGSLPATGHAGLVIVCGLLIMTAIASGRIARRQHSS